MKEINTKYQIEKGVPMSEGMGGRHAIYPFAKMAVGDSFTFEPEEYEAVRRSATRYGGSHGWKFSASSVHNRCWRRS